MLYLLAEWMGFEGIFNLVRYQTFRAGATLVTALFIGLRLEKPCQKRSPLSRRQFGQGAEALAKPV